MKYCNFLVFLSTLIFWSCDGSQVKSEITFQTDESSKLFFKNVRQAYYDLETMEEAKLEIFRLKKRSNASTTTIGVRIVNNWRFDEAYVLLEPQGDVSSSDSLEVKWSLNNEVGTVVFSGGNKTAHAKFCDQVYHLIKSDAELSLNVNGNWVALFSDTKSKEAFRISMYDYYRLVRRL